MGGSSKTLSPSALQKVDARLCSLSALPGAARWPRTALEHLLTDASHSEGPAGTYIIGGKGRSRPSS